MDYSTELRSKDECIKFIHDLCRADRDFHFDDDPLDKFRTLASPF